MKKCIEAVWKKPDMRVRVEVEGKKRTTTIAIESFRTLIADGKPEVSE